MARWAEVERDAPELAAAVRWRFEAHRHHTMATLRRDGSPRISGTEVRFESGEVTLGMMPNSLKARDLLRDPRIALHTMSEDPPGEGEDQSAWSGDAKLAGRAVERTGGAGETEPPGDTFTVDLTEVVLTRVGTPADHLTIESWHPQRGLQRRQRY